MALTFLSLLSSKTVQGAVPFDAAPLPDGLGVNIHFTRARSGELEMLAAAGFKWIRMDLGWAGIERKAGEYDFSEYDHLLGELDKFGIHAVLILDYGNPLYGDGLPPHTDASRAAFAKWAAATVHHFRNRGVLWEMWNEPNGGFWKPKANVDEYAKLALVVGKALSDAEPGETYIGPATSEVDLKFIEACFRAGCLEYWSAVSCHPYRQTDPETAALDYRELRLLIARYAPPGKSIPIISGEWGYSVAWKNQDEQRQGKYLSRQWLTNQWQQIPVSIWYDWHDDGTNPKDPEHHFGTVRNAYRPGQADVYEPKPAYLAAKTFTAQLAGFRFNKKLAMSSPDDFVLLFDKGTDVRVVAWTTAKDPHEITVPASVGDFTAVSHLGVSLPMAHADETGLKVTVSDAPIFISTAQPNDTLRLAAGISRLPLERFVHAPAEVDVPISILNPLNHQVAVRRQGDRAEQALQPGQKATVDHPITVDRSGRSEVVALGWQLPSGATVTQETSVKAINPLKCQIQPLRGSTVIVHLEDPSREGFKGNVQLDDAIENPEHAPAQHQVVEIPAGQSQADIRMTLPSDTEGHEFFGRVFNADHKMAISVAPVTFHFLPEFVAGADMTRAYELQADGNSKIASEQSLTVEPAPEPAPAKEMGVLKIEYAKPHPGWKYWQVVPRTVELKKIEGHPRAFGLWIFGDASDAAQRLRFTDSTGQTFQPGAENITWTGWRYVEFELTGDSPRTSHWGGANDGKIHYPIHWDAIYLVDRDQAHPAQGTVYLCGPTLIR